jgi:hypothetical protein
MLFYYPKSHSFYRHALLLLPFLIFLNLKIRFCCIFPFPLLTFPPHSFPLSTESQWLTHNPLLFCFSSVYVYMAIIQFFSSNLKFYFSTPPCGLPLLFVISGGLHLCFNFDDVISPRISSIMTGKFRVITIQQLVFCVFFFYFYFPLFPNLVSTHTNSYPTPAPTHPPTLNHIKYSF